MLKHPIYKKGLASRSNKFINKHRGVSAVINSLHSVITIPIITTSLVIG